MGNVMIVYCHPSKDSFTYQVKESFVRGLTDAGHTYTISDLYEMNFNPVISDQEYHREAFYNDEKEILEDVKREQEKINQADSIVFIYPVFWTASPAMMEGWFQRVWTYGYAYGNAPKMKPIDKALFLMTMGGSLNDDIRKEQVQAMKTIMIGDRMHNRAKECSVHVFDEMTRGYGNDSNREERIARFVDETYRIALEI